MRLTPNGDVRAEVRLDNSSIANPFGVETRLECASKCAQKGNCMSYNFCGARLCTLNNVSAFHSWFEDNVVNDSTCVFASMKRDEKPACFEKGKHIDIQDDVTETKCGINRKRMDGKSTDTWSDINDVTVRVCDKSDSAHGGRACPSNTVSLIDRTKVALEEAQVNCSNFGAKVYDDPMDLEAAKLIGLYVGYGVHFWVNVRRCEGTFWCKNGGQGPGKLQIQSWQWQYEEPLAWQTYISYLHPGRGVFQLRGRVATNRFGYGCVKP